MNKQPVVDVATKQDEYIEMLSKHFPGIINQLEDGSYVLDKEKLQLMIEPKNCKIVEDGYGLKWVGKKEAYHNAYIPNTTKILEPLLNDSKHFETTGNVIIKGDNLDTLKLLRKNYFEQIKMIYIDPPYNTESDEFIYNDNYTKSQEEVLEELGYSIEQKDYIKNIAGAKTHSGWLSFMYPRLLLAKDLLKEDGVIFISIDDNEQANLKLLCDEVFGQENFVAQITREAIKGGSESNHLRKSHDYILAYAKDKSMISFSGYEQAGVTLNLSDEKGKFAKGRELNKWGAGARREDSPTMWFPIPGPNGKEVYPIRNDGSEGRWRLGKKKMLEKVSNGDVIFELRKNGTYIVYEKLRDNSNKTKQFTTLFRDDYINAKGSEILKKIFGTATSIFNYSKPVELIYDLLIMADIDEDGFILDFFAGSGTTGHAVMQLNADDGGNRKYILVQLPEAIDPKKNGEAYKFVSEELKKEPTIYEIAAERLRRSGEKILLDNKASKDLKDLSNLDVGFKAYKITNDQYNAIYDKRFNEVSQKELGLVLKGEVIVDSQTILANLLLGSGITFDTKVETVILDTLYRVKDKVFILKEFELKPELFEGIEYITVYARHFTNDSFIANLTSFVNKEKIVVKG